MVSRSATVTEKLVDEQSPVGISQSAATSTIQFMSQFVHNLLVCLETLGSSFSFTFLAAIILVSHLSTF